MNFQYDLSKTGAVLAAFCSILMAGSAWGATYNLCAAESSLSMPGTNEAVPVWGFGTYNSVTRSCENVSVPGQPLVVDERGDGNRNRLVINLYNFLPEPTSLQILGQPLPRNGAPVYEGGRVRSFVKEAPPASSGGAAPGPMTRYQWDGFKAGTYLLQSATNPARQVQMGLYAAVRRDHIPGSVKRRLQAYPGVPYSREFVYVFSEIDPALHAAIVNGTYTGSIDRAPRYFLINGRGYPNIPVQTAGIGERILIRLLNAGYQTHVPQLLGGDFQVVAEDGLPYGAPARKNSVEMAAAKTFDVLFIADGAGLHNGRHPLYDARLKLANNQLPGGGMLTYIAVSANAPAQPVVAGEAAASETVPSGEAAPPVAMSASSGTVVENDPQGAVRRNFTPQAASDVYRAKAGTPLVVTAPGVIENDMDEDRDPLSALLVDYDGFYGALEFHRDGSFSYTPKPVAVGGVSDSFTYVVTDGRNVSEPATVSIRIDQ